MHIKHHTAVGTGFHFPLNSKIKIFKFIVRHQVSKIIVYTAFIFIQEYHPVLNLPGLTRFFRHIRMPACKIFPVKKKLPALLLFFCSKDIMLCDYSIETKAADSGAE